MLANGQNTIKFNFIKRKSGGLTCLCVLPSSHKPRPSVFHIFCKGYMMFNDPNYTQIPNNLFDEHMRDMTGAEFKVMAVICRKTFGWQKKKDKISISQLKTLTGIGRSQIVESLKILEHKTHIKQQKKIVKITEIETVTSPETGQVQNSPVPKLDETRPEMSTGTRPEMGHTKEINKKTITKEIYSENEFFAISKDEYNTYKQAFKCNIDMEIKKMIAWLISNPAKRPKKNYARFINGWLSRAKAEPIKEQYIDLREFKREQGAL